MGQMAGAVGLIVGVANGRSLATGIAQSVVREGACVQLTAQNARLLGPVGKVATALGGQPPPLCCDVTDAAQVAAVIAALQQRWGRLDFVVHAVAAAERADLNGRFVDTGAAGFRLAMDVSVYSLVTLAKQAEPLLRAGRHPSLLTLTYLGSQRAMPHYNVMGVAKAALESAVRYLAVDLGPAGIRVNALSPGPVRTLSAAAVAGMREQLGAVAAQAALRRGVDAAEVGDAAILPLSALGRGITGEVILVDAGFAACGAPSLDSGRAGCA